MSGASQVGCSCGLPRTSVPSEPLGPTVGGSDRPPLELECDVRVLPVNSWESLYFLAFKDFGWIWLGFGWIRLGLALAGFGLILP